MGYNDIDKNGKKLRDKGIFVSNATFAVLSVFIIALIVTEGLIVGLAGRPECEVYTPIEATTTKPISTTTSKPIATTSTTTEMQTTTASTTTAEPTTTFESGPWMSYRMPRNLIPYEYDVSLRPILEPKIFNQYIFMGSLTVRYTCEQPTNYIILHSRILEYEMSDWKLTKVGGAEVPLKRMFYYNPNDYVVLETEGNCELGARYELVLSDFTGELRADNTGFYRSDYTNADGEYVVIATSQMESTGARKTFPCFDEPSFKAKFVITLWHKTSTNFFSLSNMPVDRFENQMISGENWTATIFQQSVVMPTYLLAMVVSDFKYVESETSKGIQTNVYARPEYVDAGEADYTAMVTPQILEFFESYVGISYSLPKSDQICVPDFSAGAMENWGLVIYREQYLMYDDNTTSDSTKIAITSVIAHELAHQWFGNLVSCEWWDQLWLNEGFATYYSYLGEATVQPTWKPIERFIVDEMRRAFGTDELTTSRPIIRVVDSQNDIDLMFDSISYSKGGSILRMVNGFMGEENFVNATKEYLIAQQYGVANQNQLFNSWEKYTTHLSLPTEFSIIMETWTLQMGFPLVTVFDTDPLTNVFRISQEYYLRDPDATPRQTTGSLKYGYKWYIPFLFKRGSNLAKKAELIWLSPDQPILLTESDFILGNSDVQGYYRVNYDRDSWDRIANRLDSEFYTDIPEGNRAQLLDDAFALSSSGRLDPVVPIQMADYLYRDNSYIAWDTFTDNIYYYEYMLCRTEVYGTFKNYVLELVVPSLYNVYGWEDGPRTDEELLGRQLRTIAIDTACRYGYSDCVQQSIDYFNAWMASPEYVTVMPASYRSDALCTAIRAGGTKEWNFAWGRYNVSSTSWKSSLRYALACSKDPWILNRYLGYALDPSWIRLQDASSVLTYVAREDYGRDIAWEFMVNNWDALISRFGSPISLSGLVSNAARRFSTEFDLKLLEDFKATTPNLGGLLITVNSAIETTKANIKWRAENEENLTQWFYMNVDNVV